MSDWLAIPRLDVLRVCRIWMNLFNEDSKNTAGETIKNYEKFQVPLAEVRDLGEKYAAAFEAVSLSENKETRTQPVNSAARETIKILKTAMRQLRKRRVFVPPFSVENLIVMEIPVRDEVPNVVDVPAGLVTAEIVIVTIRQLRLILKPVEGSIIDPRADYGVRVYWGIMPPGGASLEQAAGERHLLMRVPVSGEGLPGSRFTRRKRLLFKDFLPGDSGGTVFFCMRYENSKGDAGPWGPVVSSVIP